MKEKQFRVGIGIAVACFAGQDIWKLRIRSFCNFCVCFRLALVRSKKSVHTAIWEFFSILLCSGADSNNRSRKQALCKQIKIDGIDG